MPAGIWTAKLDVPTPQRAEHDSSNIGNQKAFLSYGNISGGNIRDCDEYDNIGDFWTAKVDGPSPDRDKIASVGIGSDKAYSLAGKASGSYRNYCHEYSKSGNSWTAKTVMTRARDNHGAATIGTDKAYVYAGFNANNNCEEYSQSGNSWTNKANLPGTGREGGAYFAVNGLAYWIGGSPSGTEVEAYDPAADSWAAKNDTIGSSLDETSGATIASKGYVTGGKSGAITQTIELDPAADVWTVQTNLPSPGKYGHSSSSLGTAEFYCFGGRISAGTWVAGTDEFHMPTPPWVENLSPAHEETDVAEDANVTFDLLDNNGVDTSTLDVTINGVPVITGGVFQPGYNGTITEIV